MGFMVDIQIFCVMSTHLVMYQLPFQTMILSQIVQMSISDSQQKREAVVEDFRTIRLSNGRNLTEDTPQTAVSLNLH